MSTIIQPYLGVVEPGIYRIKQAWREEPVYRVAITRNGQSFRARGLARTIEEARQMKAALIRLLGPPKKGRPKGSRNGVPSCRPLPADQLRRERTDLLAQAILLYRNNSKRALNKLASLLSPTTHKLFTELMTNNPSMSLGLLLHPTDGVGDACKLVRDAVDEQLKSTNDSNATNTNY